MAFFGCLAVVDAVLAHRKKEKAYYLAAIVGFLVVLAFVLAFLNQLILTLILVVATGILSTAFLPKILQASERELAHQRQMTDLSAPLKVRDLGTSRGWLKIAAQWGLFKSMVLFYLLSVGIIGGMFLVLSTFYGFITMGYVVGYTIGGPIVSTFMVYRQLNKVLEKREKPLGEE